MDYTEAALRVLPRDLAEAIRGCGDLCAFEELRLRVGQAPGVVVGGEERGLQARSVRETDLLRTLERATGASIHLAAESLADGYFTNQGMRFGVSGITQMREGQVCGLRRLYSLSIRIPRSCPGILNGIFPRLCRPSFESVLILSPPGGGKTTALRELIRLLSQSGTRVGVADERGELAGLGEEGSGFDLGPCADVMMGMPKAEASMRLLRSMNPQIIAMDEISSPEDCDSISRLFGCGVELIASAHARDRTDLLRRPMYRKMLAEGCFRRVLIISGAGEDRQYRLEELQA